MRYRQENSLWLLLLWWWRLQSLLLLLLRLLLMRQLGRVYKLMLMRVHLLHGLVHTSGYLREQVSM
jgi:hypothetical protein